MAATDQGLTVYPNRSAAAYHPGPALSVRSQMIPRPSRPTYAWFLWPSLVGILVVLAMLVGVAPGDRPAAMMALVNCSVAVVLCYRFLVVNPTLGMLPTFFIMPITVLTSVSSLYFCLYSPNASVKPFDTVFRLLDDSVKFQGAALLAIVSFSVPWLIFESRERPPMTHDKFVEHCRQMAKPVFVYFMAFISLLVVLRIARIDHTTTVGYLVFGFFKYGQGLTLVPGAAWHVLGRRTKTVVLAVLAVNFIFNTFTNSRYYAFMPLVFFGFGLLFLSRISTRKKLRALVVIVLLFGVALVVGNAGRRLGLGLWYGGSEDLQRRLEVLSQKTDKLVNEHWGEEIFIRLFFTGGHQIVMLVPETYPYKPVDFPYYLSEVAAQGFLPGRIAHMLVPPIYENRETLKAIGHRITESHSVERSFIGAAWEMGGPLFVVIVGALTGLFTIVVGWAARFLFATSANLGVIVFAVLCDRMFFSVTEGLASLAHELIYGMIIGSVLYTAIGVVHFSVPRLNRTVRA